MPPDVPYALAWSGGKDSTLALDRAVRDGLDVRFLFNIIHGDSGRVRFHGVRAAMIAHQVRALGRELVQPVTTPAGFEEAFLRGLDELRGRGVSGIIFGNIHLADVRDQAFDGLQPADRRKVVRALLDRVLAAETSAGQALMAVFVLAERLQPLPHAQWAGVIDALLAEAGSPAVPYEPLAADPLLAVLNEAVQQPKLADSLRGRVAALSASDEHLGLAPPAGPAAASVQQPGLFDA